jgi:putative transposase
VRTKKRRKLPRRDRVAAQVPERPMQRWSLDFMVSVHFPASSP